MKTCFIACPIGSDDSKERKRSDKLLKFILKPVLEELSYEVIRADQIQIAGNITSQMLQSLIDANIVIGDLTGTNPNVMYELGIRHAIHRPFIHVMEKGGSLPFDIYDVRTIFYDFELENIDTVKDLLKSQVESIEKGEWTPSSPVTFSSSSEASRDPNIERLTALHELSKTTLDKMQDVQEILNAVGNIVLELRDEKKAEREDKNNQMAMQLFGSILGQGLQNPEGLRVLMELAENQKKD
jgi:hypothetical protein